MFRVIVRTDTGMARAISTPLDLVSALQYCRYLTNCCGHVAEVVANTRQWSRYAEELARNFPTTMHLFPGNPPGVMHEEDCGGK